MKASIVVPDFFLNDRLFDLSDKQSNRDNCLYPFYALRERLKQYGVLLATSDIHPPSSSDIVLYNEMPKYLPKAEDYDKSYLLLFESELIRPDNWELGRHAAFKKIFTWHDEFVDNDKYIKINFSHMIPKAINKSVVRDKLCALIAGNKKSHHPLELYSKRVEAIRWFEKNAPEDFDLYGMGWDTYYFGGSKAMQLLNKLKPLTRLLAPSFPSYRGMVESKKSALEQYKFSICFENARDIPGYITEKIFDCFFAGCVPVYWGADNVTDHIPRECFIDMRDFCDYKSLYDYLRRMPDEQYMSYLESIELFLQSKKVNKFSVGCFANTIASTIGNSYD